MITEKQKRQIILSLLSFSELSSKDLPGKHISPFVIRLEPGWKQKAPRRQGLGKVGADWSDSKDECPEATLRHDQPSVLRSSALLNRDVAHPLLSLTASFPAS